MWRIFLTVSLLCWSADGQDVTCRDHNNGEVDCILGPTETWIRPEDSATPAALSSNFSFSHSPRQSRRGQLGNFVDELDVLLSTFPEDGTPLLVFGDFNIHLEKPHATDFTSLLASFDLKRLITTATHKSGNRLDLVYTRNCTTENILVTPLHVSDHFLITFSLQLSTPAPPPPPPVTFRRNLRSLSPSHLSSAVSSSLPPPSQFSSLDVNTATDTLCSTLISSLDIICPLSSRPARTTPSNPWLSEVLREHRTKLRAAERKWHKSKDASDLSMYQSLLSSFSVDVHAAKSSYFHNKINSSSNTRLLFKTFNSLLCPPPPPPASSLTADDFATFFTNKTTAISSQFSAPHTQEPRPTPSTANTPLSSFSSLTEEEVSTLLLSSHPTTCTLDPIPSHLLQAISPTLLPSLTHIINSSLHTGTFPTAFKQARVTPLLKKPTLNTSLVENYRPISLLPFIAKTLERAVFNQLTSFLSLNNQLDVNQSGFKKGHSTETALLSVTEALRIAKAASKSSVLILLDLSAAFDTVNHQILLSTLSSLGITGTSLHWFEPYLTGRSFKVAWRGEVSRAHQLTTGVPQGSVLGPLLFSIYTTSLGHIIQAHGFSYHCYADDTQLFLSFQPDDPTVAARVSSCLADISTWMKEHHLQLNLAKTELLVLPANPSLQHDFTIQLESSLITPSRSVRNLGVTFDDQLTFTDHISKTARSCRFALHNIRKIRPFLTEHATQLIVQALVISRLDYCNALLAGLPACATKPLQMIQNAAARLVFNEPKRAHVTPLFISLHWLPLAARIKFKALTLAYRTITGSAPSYFHSLLRVYIPTRHLRSVNERRPRMIMYIIYKAPKLNNIGTTGLEYIYIDSNGETSKDPNKPINADKGVLANTLRPIFTTSMPADFGFISYSDQPPDKNAPQKSGHSKGVVMMNKDRGVWLLHSTPKFPVKRDNNFWPSTGTTNAQTFICVTFKYNEFKKIGQHLLDISAFPFDDHIPADFHEELIKVTNNNPTPGTGIHDLTSARGTLFRSIAKKLYKEEERPQQGIYDGDLYLTIAETYNTDVRVQTWGRQCGREGSYCVQNQHQVINIASVKADLGNREVSDLFKGLIDQIEDCSSKLPHVSDPDCDPDA
ncbi:unnamed protein product [Leuciscus chuanchicus]